MSIILREDLMAGESSTLNKSSKVWKTTRTSCDAVGRSKGNQTFVLAINFGIEIRGLEDASPACAASGQLQVQKDLGGRREIVCGLERSDKKEERQFPGALVRC